MFRKNGLLHIINALSCIITLRESHIRCLSSRSVPYIGTMGSHGAHRVRRSRTCRIGIVSYTVVVIVCGADPESMAFGSDVYCARHWDPFRTHLRMRLYRAGCTVSSHAMLTSACDGTIAITVSRMGNGQSPCKCLKMVGPNKQVEGHHFIMRWESFP